MRCLRRFFFGGKYGYNDIPFQALDWLQQSGEHYLSTHTSTGATVAETQELLNQHREFCVSAKVSTDRNHGRCSISELLSFAQLTLCSSAHPGEGAPLDPTGREHAG